MANHIDLYGKYNTVTDFAAIRAAGVTGAHVKLADGAAVRDDYGYVRRLTATGILVGGYGFSQPGSAADHARLLARQCRAYGAVGLVPALDLEDNPASSSQPNIPNSGKAAYAVAYLRELAAQVGTDQPVLYANNADMKIVYYAVKAAIPRAFIWVARYGGPAPELPYDLWQYTSTGAVPGVVGSVDRSTGRLPVLAGGGATPAGPSTEEEDMQRYTAPAAAKDGYIQVEPTGRDVSAIRILPGALYVPNDPNQPDGPKHWEDQPVWIDHLYRYDGDGNGQGGDPGEQGSVTKVDQKVKTIPVPGTARCGIAYSSAAPFVVMAS